MRQRFERDLRHWVTAPPLRWLAAPAYAGLSRAEVAGVAALDRFRQAFWPNPNPGDVTAIVKTFERPQMLARLLRSLRRLYPRLAVIVVDDSRCPRPLPGVEWISLPFDSGVSRGRQVALDRVATPFTWVLDDDFVLYWGSRVHVARALLDRNPEVDVLGGAVINLPTLQRSRSNPSAIYRRSRPPLRPLGPWRDGLEICDKIPNFFLARTERLRLVGWTPEIKRIDHADFFTRARGVLTTAYCATFSCLHGKTPFDRHYMNFRTDCDADRRILHERHARP